MSTTTDIILFGKVTYGPGAPKNAPRWIWRCGCKRCAHLPDEQCMVGPFKTRRAAEKDAEQAILLLRSEPCGAA